MTTPPGWHPDPSGRHQHRFWDGSGWTDQVSDEGVTSTDPIDAPAASAAQAAPTGADPWGGGSPAPTSGKSKAPMFVGIAVLVALVAGGIFFLLDRSDSTSTSGVGDHNIRLASGELAIHTFDAKAGDFVYVGFDQRENVHAAIGIPQGAIEDLRELNDVPDLEDLFAYSNDLAERLFSEVMDDGGSESSDEPRAIGDFDGVLVDVLGNAAGPNGFLGEPDKAASIIVSPVDTTYSVLMMPADDDVEVKLNVRVETPPEVPDELTSDSLDELYYSAAMEDFRGRMAEEFGLLLGGSGFSDEFTDDFSDEFTDDWSDWSDDFTDDWSGWSDDFTDDWSDWSDDWSDWSDEWSDTWSEFDDVMSDWSDEAWTFES